jgi:hypothetical protein
MSESTAVVHPHDAPRIRCGRAVTALLVDVITKAIAVGLLAAVAKSATRR